MYVFKEGLRKKISFKNTYATQQFCREYDLCFAKPLNKSFALICIVKGFVVLKSDKKSINSGYLKICGGYPSWVFNDLFGTNTEENFGYKYLKKKEKKEKIKNKIKKIYRL